MRSFSIFFSLVPALVVFYHLPTTSSTIPIETLSVALAATDLTTTIAIPGTVAALGVLAKLGLVAAGLNLALAGGAVGGALGTALGFAKKESHESSYHHSHGSHDHGYHDNRYHEHGYHDHAHHDYGYNDVGYHGHGYHGQGYHADGYHDEGYHGYNHFPTLYYGYNSHGRRKREVDQIQISLEMLVAIEPDNCYKRILCSAGTEK